VLSCSDLAAPHSFPIFKPVNFTRRLKFYGFGFAIGLMIVYAIFGTRSCVTPNEMKMQELVFQDFDLSDRARCKLRCLKKNEALLKIELRHFEVNYDLSSVHKEPCGEYFIQPKQDHRNEYRYKILMLDCDTITRINDIQITSGQDCTCP
jgi:hypothetical protein